MTVAVWTDTQAQNSLIRDPCVNLSYVCTHCSLRGAIIDAKKIVLLPLIPQTEERRSSGIHIGRKLETYPFKKHSVK